MFILKRQRIFFENANQSTIISSYHTLKINIISYPLSVQISLNMSEIILTACLVIRGSK